MTKTANISAETSESIKAIETLFNNGWNLDQLRHFDGFEIWHAQKMAEASTARERLAAKMAPAYEALGIVASTNAGKFLFALAYDADCGLDHNADKAAQYDGKRPTKSSQEAKYYEGLSRGERNSFVTALAAMCEDASNGKASRMLCRRIINMEIDEMRNRTAEQMTAAPMTNIFPKCVYC